MKRRTKPRERISLLDVLTDGFEKNEILENRHTRTLPLPDEQSAIAKFTAFVEEATRWHGKPARTLTDNGRRLARWPDIEIRQAGCGILIRIRSAWFVDWWGDPAVWKTHPLNAVYAWADEEKEPFMP